MAAVHIVVMFTDLVGSTELSSRLAPDAAEALRQTHFALLRRAASKNEGTEIKNLGDGLMVTFRSASSALACAVAMQQGIDQHNRSGREPLSVRIGISAGEAVLEDGDYFGEPVVEASRLCATAEGKQILASDLVRVTAGRRATQNFRPVGELSLKGLTDPVTTVEVAWEPLATGSAVPLPARLAVEPPVGFFGRQAELARLGEALKATEAGEGVRAVLVGGEPGMGKTTLCGEFARAAHAQGTVVLYGRSDEELAIPYQPFVEALGSFVTHAPVELLTDHVSEHGSELSALVPELGRRVGDLPPSGSADPETQRYRLFAAVVGLLAAVSGRDPCVIVLDDIHWADRPTLTLLRHLVGASVPMRLLVLATYRQSELTRDHPLTETLAALHREAGVSRLPLTGLDDVEVMALMESGAGHELSGDFVDLAHALRRETDGNPFFVWQLLRHLAEGGWLYQDGAGRWRARGDLAELSLPESVREVVGHRVARLGAEADRLLSTAAVIGRDFDANILFPVAGVTESEMIDVLDQAVTAGLLIDVGPGRYTFSHAVIQHALYEALTPTRRALVHRQVAETLEAIHGEGPGPRVGEVARHWLATTRPSDVTKAFDYARWAGEAALAGLAPEEAIRWFTQAIELAQRERLPDEEIGVELLIQLGTAQRWAGIPAFRETLLDASHRAEALGDHNRLTRAVLANCRGTYAASGIVDQERIEALNAALAAGDGDSTDRAQLLATLAAELTFTDDWPRRRGLAAEALAMARRLGDPTTLQRVVGRPYLGICVPETLEERLAMTAEALASAAGQTDPFVLHGVHRWRLYACANAGDIEAIDTLLPEVVRHGQATRDPYTIWTATMDQSGRRLLDGDLETAEALALEGLRIGTESGQSEAGAAIVLQMFEFRRQQGRLSEVEADLVRIVEQYPGLPVVRAVLAHLYCELDKRQEAASLLRAAAVDEFAGIPNDAFRMYGLALYAEVSAVLHDGEPARALYDELAPWHDQLVLIPLVVNGGTVALYLGMLATVLRRFDDAKAHFAEALDAHQRLRAPYWIARTQLEHARMLVNRRAPDDGSGAMALLQLVEATAAERGFAALTRHSAGLRADYGRM